VASGHICSDNIYEMLILCSISLYDIEGLNSFICYEIGSHSFLFFKNMYVVGWVGGRVLSAVSYCRGTRISSGGFNRRDSYSVSYCSKLLTVEELFPRWSVCTRGV
jgi:hypothetical protein